MLLLHIRAAEPIYVVMRLIVYFKYLVVMDELFQSEDINYLISSLTGFIDVYSNQTAIIQGYGILNRIPDYYKVRR